MYYSEFYTCAREQTTLLCSFQMWLELGKIKGQDFAY